jgi:ribosome-binding protein aMBF1 (putative translation factor)
MIFHHFWALTICIALRYNDYQSLICDLVIKEGVSMKRVIELPSVHIDKDALRQRIGQRIRLRREGMGLSQRALGDALGLSQTAVFRVEAGENALTVEGALKASQVLGLSVEELLNGEAA